MLHSTKGIVLHTFKYAETSLITHVYTETFGLQSYLIKGVRKPKSRFRAGLFQPLTLLDMVVCHKEQNSLQQVREARIAEPCHAIPSDIRKSSIALFMTELIIRSIREEEPNNALFSFLWHSVLLLDATATGLSLFPLLFAVRFTRYLGFHPQANRTEKNRFFDLREGSFTSLFSHPDECLDETLSGWLFQLAGPDIEHTTIPLIPGPLRQTLLEKLLLYYRLHLPGMKPLRSHTVLHTVLS